MAQKPTLLQLTIIQSLTNRQSPLTPPKGELGLPVAAPRGCNGALIALQRGCRCNPTSTPLQGRGAAVARRKPLFCPFPTIKNSRTFAFLKSRKGLSGSPGSPFGGVRGGFCRGRRIPIRPLLLMKTQIFEQFHEHNFVNIYHSFVGSRPVATASVPRGLTCSFEPDIWVIIYEPRGGRDGSRPYLWKRKMRAKSS